MPKSADVRVSVSAFSIPDRHFSHFEVEFGSPEEEVKISEWIEVPKIASVRLDLFEVFTKEGPSGFSV